MLLNGVGILVGFAVAYWLAREAFFYVREFFIRRRIEKNAKFYEGKQLAHSQDQEVAKLLLCVYAGFVVGVVLRRWIDGQAD